MNEGLAALFLTRAPVLPCILLRQASPKSFKFINFCLAQGCLWSVCHLHLQTAVRKGVPHGTNDRLRGYRRFICSCWVPLWESWSISWKFDFCNYHWSSVACWPRAQRLSWSKVGDRPSPKWSNFSPFPSNIAVPPLCQTQMMNSDCRKAVGHKFYIKSQMIFLPVYNCRTLAQQSTNSSQALNMCTAES